MKRARHSPEQIIAELRVTRHGTIIDHCVGIKIIPVDLRSDDFVPAGVLAQQCVR